MFPRQLPLYSYVISLMVSLCFVCVCARVPTHLFHLSDPVLPSIWRLTDFGYYFSPAWPGWHIMVLWKIHRNKMEGAGRNFFTPNSVYVFAFHAFETSILWSTIEFWKLYCNTVYLCSIHYQRITSYVELFFQTCQAHFLFLRYFLKCWFLKLLTVLKKSCI